MIIDIQRYWGEKEIFYPGELSAKIIDAMQQDGCVILRSKEGRSGQLSGLFDLLDQLSFYYKWNKSNITIETTNFLLTHSEYNIKYTCYVESGIQTDLSLIQHRPWNKEKMYGMFIGRTNVSRLHAAHKHKTFEFKQHGLTSFNQDIKHHIDRDCLLDYLCSSNRPFNEVIDIDSYSDISTIIEPPITGQYTSDLWNAVYEKIAIEIICETAEDPGCFSMSEKMFRPMLYRRPFLLIAAPGAIDFYKNAKNNLPKLDIFMPDGTKFVEDDCLEIKFFENIIPIEYDNYGGVDRVDFVFDILHEIVRTGKINSILNDCASDIEHNYNEVINTITRYKKQKSHYLTSFDYSTWDKPNYNDK